MAENKFSREELDIMKWDWIHCRNVQQVAELHACRKQDVIDALNLDEKPPTAARGPGRMVHAMDRTTFLPRLPGG